ncbi:solute carrier family 22 member 7 isoform X1 [Silurus meridionalis]|nr:solute carrier family 22 member 7 isoform X1 [Silurus meridionalis]
MKFEDLLEELDGFGRFQKMVVFLSFIGRFTLPCHFLLNNYIGAIPPHHCNLGSEDGNLTLEQRMIINIPKQNDGTFTSCHMFSEPQYHLLNDTHLKESNYTDVLVVECQNGWIYDNSTFISTLASESVATVVKEKLPEMQKEETSRGTRLKRYGRKTMLMVSYVLALCFAMASVFSSSIIMFAVLRFFTGLSITGIVIVTSVLKVSFLKRVKHLLQFLLNRCNGAKTHLDLHLQEYGKVMQGSNLVLSSIVSEGENRTYTYLDLMKTPNIRRLALLTGICWYGVASSYYGISFNIKGFGLNLYLNQFLYGTVEIPAKVVVYLLLDRIGRRRTEVGGLLMAGCALIINVFISKDQWIVRSVIGVLGKGFTSIAFSTLVLYCSELYPTVIRQNGMGYNSFMGRLGVALAPLILLLDDVWLQLSQVILCVIAVVTGLVASRLPETKDRCLPETIEDIEGTRSIFNFTFNYNTDMFIPSEAKI